MGGGKRGIVRRPGGMCRALIAVVRALIAVVRALIAGGKIDEAHQIVRSVLALEPMHAEGRALREQLQNEV